MPTTAPKKQSARKKPLWPGVSLAVMLSLVVGAFTLQATQDVTVPRRGVWRVPPRVHVCSTAPDWVMDEVSIAMEWWEVQHGHAVFDGLVRGDCTQLCDPGVAVGAEEAQPAPCAGLGVVSVDAPGLDLPPTHGGRTTTMVWRDQIQWAVVELAMLTGRDEEARNWTVTHELAHALGYQHAQGRGKVVVKHHILSPSYGLGGFRANGMGFDEGEED